MFQIAKTGGIALRQDVSLIQGEAFDGAIEGFQVFSEYEDHTLFLVKFYDGPNQATLRNSRSTAANHLVNGVDDRLLKATACSLEH